MIRIVLLEESGKQTQPVLGTSAWPDSLDFANMLAQPCEEVARHGASFSTVTAWQTPRCV